MKRVNLKFLILFLAIFPLLSDVFGQGQANVWYFGTVGLDFNTSPPTQISALDNNPMGVASTNMEVAASISDANGNFLFGILSNKLYDGGKVARYTLPNLTDEAAQGAMIVPVPGSSTSYYVSIVTVGVNNNCQSLPGYYFKVDVSGSGNNNITNVGAFTPVNLQSNITQGQMILPKTDGSGNLTGEYWLVHHERGSDRFFVYSIAAGGITLAGGGIGTQSIGPVMGCNPSSVSTESIAYFKANACFNQFAYAYENNIYLFDFNTNTGAINYTNSSVNISKSYGIEFSPNGQNLFISTGTDNAGPFQIWRVPVAPGGVAGSTFNTPVLLNGSLTGILRGGCLQLAPDGRIYTANLGNYNKVDQTTATKEKWLGVIDNPNSATPTFTEKGVIFNTNGDWIGMGLPSFITSLVSTVISVDVGGTDISNAEVCVDESVTFNYTISGSSGTDPQWTIDGISYPVGQTSITRSFTTAGTKSVTLTVKDACGRTKPFNSTIKVNDKIIPGFSLPATVCPSGTLITGTAGTNGTPANYVWYDTDNTTVLGTGSTYNYIGTLPKTLYVGDGTPGSGPYTTGEAVANFNSNNPQGGWQTKTSFTANKDITLSSVAIKVIDPNTNGYCNSNYTFTVKVQNGGVDVPGLSKSMTTSGCNKTITVPLNFAIASGDYDLVITSPVTAFKVTLREYGTTAQSWSDSGGLISIRSTSGYGYAGSGPFGDWVVLQPKPCSQKTEIKLVENCCTQPTITTQPTSQTVCAGSNVTLSVNSSTGSVNYQWQVDEGSGFTNLSTGTSLTLNNVTTAMSGNIYRAVITGTGICTTNSNTATLTVNPVPVAPTVTGNNSPYCHNSNISLTAASAGAPSGTVYTWSLSNSTTSTSNPFVANNATSTTVLPTGVTASYTNNGVTCTSTNTNVSVTVKTNPSVSLGTTTQTICSGTQMTAVSVSITNGTGFTWQGAGTNASGFTSTVTNVANTSGNIQETLSATTAANGTVTYTITPTNGTDGSGATCVGTAQTHTVTVTPSVTPSVTINATKTTICAGDNVTFTATPTNGGTSPDYQWKINGNNAGTNSATFSSTTLNNNDVVTVEMTSNANCPTPATVTSNQITMTVDPVGTASVTISASTSSICKGTSITFTPTPTNGGTPSYQWMINNAVIETNNSTFTSTTLEDGDKVKAIMTSSGTCVTGSPAESNEITINVTEPLAPSVIIVSDATNNEICSGQEVTFTATPTHGGTPTYQWKLNGVDVGTGLNTYTNDALNPGDEITVVMTTSETCVSSSTATSNIITMTVTGTVVPKVTIVANENTICAGEEVIFTATPENGGSTPSYQWMVNGTNAGTNSPNFSSSTLANGAQVTVTLTSSLGCASPATATSDPATITVNPKVTADVSISGNNSICVGTSVTFTATPTHGGSAPAYQWKVNGNNEGTNSNEFTTSSLQNGDVVTVEMTSNETCVTGSPVTSNTITMDVATKLEPTVTISASTTTICSGESVTFTPTPTNGGTTPTYQWFINNNLVGGGATFTSSTLSDGNVVSAIMTTSETCVTSTTSEESNQIEIEVTDIVTPTVTIDPDKTTICENETVNFTAISSGEGSTPSYQWMVNGTNAGTDSPNFSSTTLVNGAQVTVTLTSSSGCASPATATSDPVTITVNPKVTADVSISGNNSICEGTSVTFTATPTHGGSAPAYQWKVNGNDEGTNSNEFITSTLQNGDVVTVEMTSNETCVTGSPATSNVITMDVATKLEPTVSISASTNTICSGESVTFTPTPTHGGTTPTYQWFINNDPVGGGATFTSSTLSNGNVVSVKLTTSETCVTSTTSEESNKIEIKVTDIVTPTVTIVEINNKTSICSGETVTFRATPNSEETNPSYQWKVNGANVGGNNNEFSSNSLQNADEITVVLTSSLGCASSPIANSNPITITVTPTVTATVSIAGANEFCRGEQITFTSTSSNGGSTPTYQWKVNSENVGGNNSTFTSNNLQSGDVVSLEMTSNATCVTNPNLISNAIPVTVKEPIEITDPLISNSICEGSNLNLTISATGSGPISYQWYFNNNMIPGATNNFYPISNVNSTHEGEYKVEVTSSCGTKTSPAYITVNPVVDIAKQVEGSKVCTNENAIVTIINSQNNISYQAFNMSNQPLNNPVIGNGQDKDLILNSSGLSVGSNTITIKARAGECGEAILSQTAIVTILDNVENGDIIGPLTICDNDLANIPFMISHVAGATSYKWFVGDNPPAELVGQTSNSVNITLDQNQFTNITVIPFLDDKSCSSASIVVEQMPAYDGSAFLSVTEDTICAGNEITFTIENFSPGNTEWERLPDYAHEISGSKISRTIRFDAAGAYTIQVSFDHPCNGTIELEKEVYVIAPPVAKAGDDITLEDFANVVLDASTSTSGNYYTSVWTSSDPSSDISRPNSLITAVTPKSVNTIYYLTITTTNEASCSATDAVNVVIDLLVKVPNIFSPNGDGIHDLLMVNNIDIFPNAVMYVYNQWGQEVYKSSPGYTDPWDGKKDGTPLPVSTYYYVLELNEADYAPIKGSVTIVK